MLKKASGFFSTTLGERIKGIVIAIVGTIVTAVYDIIESGGEIPATRAEWKVIIMKGVSFGILYIGVTFFGSGKPSLLERTIANKKE